MDIIGKFLPPQVQKLLKDKEVANDMSILLTEIDKEIKAAAKNAPKGKLKEAFNNAATVVSAAHSYMKNGKLSLIQIAQLGSKHSAMKESFNTFRTAYKEQDPAILAYAQSFKENTKIYDSVKNLLVKTNGTVFRLEQGENGQGYAVDLVTGNNFRIALAKQDYDEIQAILSKAQPPKKDAPPPAPPSL